MWDMIFQGVKTGIETMKQIPVTDNISLYHFCIALLFITIIVRIIPIILLTGANSVPTASRGEAEGRPYTGKSKSIDEWSKRK